MKKIKLEMDGATHEMEIDGDFERELRRNEEPGDDPMKWVWDAIGMAVVEAGDDFMDATGIYDFHEIPYGAEMRDRVVRLPGGVTATYVEE